MVKLWYIPYVHLIVFKCFIVSYQASRRAYVGAEQRGIDDTMNGPTVLSDNDTSPTDVIEEESVASSTEGSDDFFFTNKFFII